MKTRAKIKRTVNLTTQQENSLRRSKRLRKEDREQAVPPTSSAAMASRTKKEEHIANTKFASRKSRMKRRVLTSNVEKLRKEVDREPRKLMTQGVKKRQKRIVKCHSNAKFNKKAKLSSLKEQRHRKHKVDDTYTTIQIKTFDQAVIKQPVETNTQNFPTWRHKTTFSMAKHHSRINDVTRYCDVAFLDNNHVLAVDDSFINARTGCLCCFRLDGTLVADYPLPGYPWTVIALSATEAVVTLRQTKSRGLMWLSIDIKRGTIECTKMLTMEHDAYGIAYNKEKENYVVSHYQNGFLTILNKEGVEIGKITVPQGATYRCIFSGENIIYLDLAKKHVKAIELSGREYLEFPKENTLNPINIDRDIEGNIYVANYSQNVCQFDSHGNYVKTLFDFPAICGIGLNRRSDMMAVTHGKSVSIYQLHN